MEIIQQIMWNIIGLLGLTILPPTYLLIRWVTERRIPDSLYSDLGFDPLGKKRVLWMIYISLMTLSLLYLDNQYQWIWIGGVLLTTSVTISLFREDLVDILTISSYLWIMVTISITTGNPHWITGWCISALIFSWLDEKVVWLEIGWWIFMVFSIWT